jgi:hypothetical protein
VLPVEDEPQKTDIELLGLFDVENPEDGAGLFKVDCHVELACSDERGDGEVFRRAV